MVNIYQGINYGSLIDEAMHYIVRRALSIAVHQGLPGDHHFFISFLTRHPGVTISDRLRQQYPNEMTIVLQYQFDDLFVGTDHFSVVLSFDSVKERIVVPFMALTAFADPSVRFGLRFSHGSDDDYYMAEDHYASPKPRSMGTVRDDELTLHHDDKPPKNGTATSNKAGNARSDNIIAFEDFRLMKKHGHPPHKSHPDAKK